MPRTSAKAVLATGLLILITYLVSGCVSWRVETAPPAELVSGPRPPGELRVTRQSGDRIMLTSPRVIGDSLLGFQAGSTVGVELGDIQELATRHSATGKSILLVLGVAAVVVLTIGIIAGASLSNGGY